MTPEQKEFLDRIDRRYNRMRNTLLTIIGVILTAWVGQFFLSGVRQGGIEKSLDQTISVVNSINKNYMPLAYNWQITKLYTLNTEKIVGVLSGKSLASNEIRKIDEEFENTIEVMQNLLIQQKGGMTEITRSIKPKK